MLYAKLIIEATCWQGYGILGFLHLEIYKHLKH